MSIYVGLGRRLYYKSMSVRGGQFFINLERENSFMRWSAEDLFALEFVPQDSILKLKIRAFGELRLQVSTIGSGLSPLNENQQNEVANFWKDMLRKRGVNSMGHFDRYAYERAREEVAHYWLCVRGDEVAPYEVGGKHTSVRFSHEDARMRVLGDKEVRLEFKYNEEFGGEFVEAIELLVRASESTKELCNRFNRNAFISAESRGGSEIDLFEKFSKVLKVKKAGWESA